MRLEFQLNEDPSDKNKVYWSGKAIHRESEGDKEEVILQVISNSFVAGIENEYLLWYERVTVRMMKDLTRQRGQGIIRRMLLKEEYINKNRFVL